MATAICQNCDRDEWTLRKHPADYAGNGPDCPDCGSTKVEVKYDGDRERSRGQGGGREPQRQGGGQGGQTPARQQQQGGGGGAPAARQPESAGDAVAQSMLALTDDSVSTSQQVDAFQSVGGVLMDAVGRYTKYREEVNQQKQQHAQNVDIQKAEDYPRCVECGHVFKHISPNQQEISCPECGEQYEITE